MSIPIAGANFILKFKGATKLNLVCFANYTAGGLICDLYNNTQSLSGHKTTNAEHSCFKIGDNGTVYRDFSNDLWNQRLAKYQNSDSYMGTHNHPSSIPDLTSFKHVIAVTVTTRKSMLYRWIRMYNDLLSTSILVKTDDEMFNIDAARITSKQCFVAFEPDSRCDNVEFQDIVDGSFVKSRNLDYDYFEKWKQSNYWLYDDASNSWPTARFIEAEWEIQHGRPFVYL